MSPGLVKSRKATLNAGTLVRCVLGDRNELTETIAFDAMSELSVTTAVAAGLTVSFPVTVDAKYNGAI